MAKPQNISETTTEPHLVRARVKVRGGGRGRVGVATRVGVKARARVRVCWAAHVGEQVEERVGPVAQAADGRSEAWLGAGLEGRVRGRVRLSREVPEQARRALLIIECRRRARAGVCACVRVCVCACVRVCVCACVRV